MSYYSIYDLTDTEFSNYKKKLNALSKTINATVKNHNGTLLPLNSIWLCQHKEYYP